MSPSNSLEIILERFKDNKEVEEVTLISRSGMHIAGKVPENSHRETFVAMSAILLGAAETATSELKEDLTHVLVELKRSKVLILNGGPKALLAFKLSKNANVDKVISETSQKIKEMHEYL